MLQPAVVVLGLQLHGLIARISRIWRSGWWKTHDSEFNDARDWNLARMSEDTRLFRFHLAF